ncbi:cell wall-active antibiotic response 4TMS protein YvqF [Haloactinospora alba]|uniref:Cell wall-active antibiotic response 4TMS protein YvqF n=1 Tax=Haloactinospora alba TaxID=405555 RepID=A0A543NAA4_9ACTN|nr:DUF1707 domain-containing protein [Haloactinospora alba]TQN28726.1 cell wall-active antibiotic response 4TMS protein YvqF [Haloactinospora alba]
MESDHVRVSDAERERLAEQLREAHVQGRLSQEEHEQRLSELYLAKTRGELEQLRHDLPPEEETAGRGTGQEEFSTAEARQLASGSNGRENLAAILGGMQRGGRWLVEPNTTVSVVAGGAELDLREAVLAQREVTMQCAVILGGLNITVPPGVRVINNTNAFLGGTETNSTDMITDPGAPTVRLTGTCLLGGISVRTKARVGTKHD